MLRTEVKTEVKTEDLAQTSPVKKLHELYKKCDHSERYSTRILSSGHPAFFHPTDDRERWIPTFFPRLNETVGEKKLDPEVFFP